MSVDHWVYSREVLEVLDRSYCGGVVRPKVKGVCSRENGKRREVEPGGIDKFYRSVTVKGSKVMEGGGAKGRMFL